MKETIERAQHILHEHLRKIETDVENHGGFKSPQELDDLKDCLQGLECCKHLECQTEKRIM